MWVTRKKEIKLTNFEDTFSAPRTYAFIIYHHTGDSFEQKSIDLTKEPHEPLAMLLAEHLTVPSFIDRDIFSAGNSIVRTKQINGLTKDDIPVPSGLVFVMSPVGITRHKISKIPADSSGIESFSTEMIRNLDKSEEEINAALYMDTLEKELTPDTHTLNFIKYGQIL